MARENVIKTDNTDHDNKNLDDKEKKKLRGATVDSNYLITKGKFNTKGTNLKATQITRGKKKVSKKPSLIIESLFYRIKRHYLNTNN